ncbi:MAG: ABC transporter ATP-binding protein [Nitrospira sp.]|nr:ABC transporter ATP-binding protein [Nitrospira sp.]
MSSELAIGVKDLSKCYLLYENPHDRLKQSIVPRFQSLVGLPRAQYYREYWALKDCWLDIMKGETVGVIGRNGSGKSTLLQLICGTLTPTSGTVEVRGRVAALLELGAGFHPEFTGRENVYINGALLGLAADEIDERFDSIAAFADIGGYLDQPVKTYSSGMLVRLAFAVQAQVSPDILVVDEALAVGDAKFQAKCFERLRQLKEGGTSILLVTHSSEQIVAHCTQAVLLNQGSIQERGEPRHVVNCYMDLLFGKARSQKLPRSTSQIDCPMPDRAQIGASLNCVDDVFSTHPGYNAHEYRWGDGTATILDYYLAAGDKSYPAAISTGQTVILCVAVKFHADMVSPILGITVKTKEGVTVYGTNSEILEGEDFTSKGRKDSVVVAEAAFQGRLAQGDYFISVGVATRRGETVTPHDRRYDAIHLQVLPANTFLGLANLDLKLTVREMPT